MYQESALFRNAMLRCQNIISLVPRDRSLFIAWEGEGAIGGDHLIFRRTKGGISRNPKGEITENFGRITVEGEPLKFAWMDL